MTKKDRDLTLLLEKIQDRLFKAHSLADALIVYNIDNRAASRNNVSKVTDNLCYIIKEEVEAIINEIGEEI